jgi:hypothetical protein
MWAKHIDRYIHGTDTLTLVVIFIFLFFLKQWRAGAQKKDYITTSLETLVPVASAINN